MILSYKQIQKNGLIEFTYNKKKSEGTYHLIIICLTLII